MYHVKVESDPEAQPAKNHVVPINDDGGHQQASVEMVRLLRISFIRLLAYLTIIGLCE